MTIPVGDIIWGVRIEGLGDPSLVTTPGTDDARFRFADKAPAGDSFGLYKDVLQETSPGVISYSLDFRTGRATTGSMEVGLLHTAEVRDMLSNLTPEPVARLSTVADEFTTAITLPNYLTGQGKVIYIKREAFYLETHQGGGVYDVQRGVLGTRVQDHDPNRDGEDVEAFEDMQEQEARRVELFYVAPGGGYADEVTVWSGVIEDLGTEDHLDLLVIKVIGALGVMRDTVFLRRQWSATVDAINLGAARGEVWGEVPALAFFHPDVPEWSTDANIKPDGKPNLSGIWSFDDEILVEWLGSLFTLKYLDDAATLDRWAVEPWSPFGQLAESLQETLTDGQSWRDTSCRQIFCTDPQTPMASRLPKNALDCVLALVTSTRRGDNGVHDLKVDFGISLPLALLDETGILQLRDQLGELLDVDRFFIGLANEPEKALDKIERELLHPFGLGWTVTSAGLLGVAYWSELPASSSETALDADTILKVISQDYGLKNRLDEVEFRYTPGRLDNPKLVDTTNSTAQQRLLGAQRAQAMQGTAISDPAQAYEWALTHLLRWRNKVPIIELEAHMSANVAVGDTVLLTDVGVMGKGKTEGVTSSRCIVLGKQIDVDKNRLRYKLAHIGIHQGRLGRISASGEVSAYDGPSLTITLTPGAFIQAGGNGVYDDDIFAFEAAFTVQICDEFGQQQDAAILVDSVDTSLGQIVLNTAPSSAPSFGDLVLLSAYPTATAAMRARDAFIADNAGGVGTNPDAGYEYTG